MVFSSAHLAPSSSHFPPITSTLFPPTPHRISPPPPPPPKSLLASVPTLLLLIKTALAARATAGDVFLSLAASSGGSLDLHAVLRAVPAPQTVTADDVLPPAYYAAAYAAALRPIRSAFDAPAAAPDVAALVDRVARLDDITPAVLVTALLYLDRLLACAPRLFATSRNVHALFATAVLLSAKFHEDDFYSTAFFADVFRVPLARLVQLESLFLDAIAFRLFVKRDEYAVAEHTLIAQALDSPHALSVLKSLFDAHVSSVDAAFPIVRSWLVLTAGPPRRDGTVHWTPSDDASADNRAADTRAAHPVASAAARAATTATAPAHDAASSAASTAPSTLISDQSPFIASSPPRTQHHASTTARATPATSTPSAAAATRPPPPSAPPPHAALPGLAAAQLRHDFAPAADDPARYDRWAAHAAAVYAPCGVARLFTLARIARAPPADAARAADALLPALDARVVDAVAVKAAAAASAAASAAARPRPVRRYSVPGIVRPARAAAPGPGPAAASARALRSPGAPGAPGAFGPHGFGIPGIGGLGGLYRGDPAPGGDAATAAATDMAAGSANANANSSADGLLAAAAAAATASVSASGLGAHAAPERDEPWHAAGRDVGRGIPLYFNEGIWTAP